MNIIEELTHYFETILGASLGDSIQLLTNYIYIELWIYDRQSKFRIEYPGEKLFGDDLIMYINSTILATITEE